MRWKFPSLAACLLMLLACAPEEGPETGFERTPESESAGIASDTPEPAHPSRRVILFLGDSLSAGYGLDPDQAFPALVQKKIDALGWPFEVVNAGVSGDTTSGGLSRIDWLLRRPVDVLFLELGGNDGLRGISPQVTKANLQAIIDRTRGRYPGAAVVVAGMLVPPNMGPDYFDEFQKIFPDIASRNDATLIPFLLEGVAGQPQLNLPDGIHPTAEGHRLVAEHVWKFLKSVLQQRI